uniref:Uncharacterized protein n=1 Tax=Romanomermis culicivorax TaxID=13658 RepID=A0A915KLW0_ROMCU
MNNISVSKTAYGNWKSELEFEIILTKQFLHAICFWKKCRATKTSQQTYLDSSAGPFFTQFQPLIDRTFQIALQTSPEIFKHCRTAAQNYIIVEASSDVDGALLNNGIDRFRQRRCVIRISKLKN